MTFTFPSLSCIWDQATSSIGSLGFGQTEIIIFVIAFSMHYLFFGRCRVPGNKGKDGSAKRFANTHPEQMKTKGRKPRQPAAAESLDCADEIASIRTKLHQGSVKEALTSLDVLRRAGACLNAATLNELVEDAVKLCYDDAWAFVDCMRAFGVKPDRTTCLTFLKSLKRKASSAHVTKALALLDEIDGEVDEMLLNAAIEACINTGSADLLTAQFEKMNLHKTVQMKNPHSYASLIRAYGFIGNIAGVWQTWRCMHKCHVLPTSITLGCMVEALTTNGHVEASYELVREMVDDPSCKSLVNSVIYGSVLKGFSHLKKFDCVWSVYEEMLGQKIQFSIVTFNTLLDACARSGDLVRIPALLESMTAQGLEPNLITYGIVIKGYCQENKLTEALAVWESMVRTTKFQPDEIMYNTILDGCARKGLYERGMTLLSEMQQAGIQPSNFTLSVLVKLASRANMLDRAFELTEEITKKYKFRLNVHVFNNLIQACVMRNSLPRAFEVLKRMVQERVRPDLRTYTLLTRACVATGDCKDAIALVRAAMGLQDIHETFANVPAFAQLPKGLPSDLIVEILQGVADRPNTGILALALYKDLPFLKLPAQLQLRLAKSLSS
eukprot:CAMPEP_0169108516 /NCGR_PEP_ID=MMETSP1015-20121227/25469_1 /TAXON_ID=342587 /ORGANISM="Karlodinium micrum, Strain CCMP2283" /LENGTH=610 /DNA_ID=CAMNT_0009170143 /DNA_START=70 /DNA_END=1902 /DNA_ORIENTATION=+